MRLERVLELINNMDESERRRKFMPQHSTVVVNQHGEVIDVIRYREEPSEQTDLKHMKMYPDSVQFTATPGSFPTIEALQRKLDDCIWAHSQPRRKAGIYLNFKEEEPDGSEN